MAGKEEGLLGHTKHLPLRVKRRKKRQCEFRCEVTSSKLNSCFKYNHYKSPEII